CCAAIDRLIETERTPEILQLSGGEPTLHPEFDAIADYACNAPIDLIMVNTNGIRIANDDAFLDGLAARRQRMEVYLQFDGFDDDGCRTLRGESLVAAKLRAVERLGEAGVRTILVVTMQPGVNLAQTGRLVDFAVERPWITGVSFQPACYVGRRLTPADLETRVTFPDVIHAVAEQSAYGWRTADFSPLPCAHPNAHTLAYAYRSGGNLLPLARFIDLDRHLDLLSGRITFNRERARELIAVYLERQACGERGCSPSGAGLPNRAAVAEGREHEPLALEFLEKALRAELAPSDVFRITTTSFMDAYNFDLRQLIKSCVHQILPSGHIVPFSAYNLFYRHGQTPLPALSRHAANV
ncbi:MAG: radical SAM protein, partial [Planctomycetales bacterium]|nr:radical SAM protein [Planctomycetales bacterium]